MSNEYYALILEFNARVVKLGFAREAIEHVQLTPSHPTWQKYAFQQQSQVEPSFLGLSSHCLDNELKIELLGNSRSDSALERMLEQYQKDYDLVQWFDWSTNGFVELSRLVRHLISTSLLVSPLFTKLFVVDNGLLALSKRMFCETMTKMLTCAAVVFLSYSLCTSIASGVSDALVIDFGWETCKIYTVIDYRVVRREEFVEFSHESIHYRIMKNRGADSFSEVEMVIQDAVCESEDVFAELGLEQLPEVIANLIQKTAIDNRPLLSQNIIITGFFAQYSRFQMECFQETTKALQTLSANGLENLGAWCGASIYCSTILFTENYDDWKHMQIGSGKLTVESARELERYHG